MSSQVHDSDGPVAPSVGCGRAVADVDLFLYGRRVLLWQKRAVGSVTMLTFWLNNKTILNMGTECPNYATSIWDLYV